MSQQDEIVYLDCKQGRLAGKNDAGEWLVDVGSTIYKSKVEPVKHAFKAGWYLLKDKPVYVSHYTAWMRDGTLTPVYQYKDHSRPPFGSNWLYEREVSAMQSIDSPYLQDDEVMEIADKFSAELAPITKELRELQAKEKNILQAKKDALTKACAHKWRKDGSEEETSKSGRKQEWCCEVCELTNTQYYSVML